jgi:hypothetical protein
MFSAAHWSPLDLAIEPLNGVGGVQLRPVRDGETHVGQHVSLGLVEEAGELRQFGAQLVEDASSRGFGAVDIALRERGGDECRDDVPALLAGMRESIAHEVKPTTLPARIQHLGDRRLDALVSMTIDAKLAQRVIALTSYSIG